MESIMKKIKTLIMLNIFLLGIMTASSVFAVPKITGSPKIVSPDLLAWPSEISGVKPSLTEPTANRLNDLRGQVGRCDIVLSTAGNYHMALRELWKDYLKENAESLDIKTWYYTTSPPISPEQIASKTVQFGNLELDCVPQVAVGP